MCNHLAHHSIFQHKSLLGYNAPSQARYEIWFYWFVPRLGQQKVYSFQAEKILVGREMTVLL
jgi:hypothetical protein